jgi:hypothetical protein
MKKLILLFFGFMILMYQAHSQEVSSDISTEAAKIIKPKIENEAKVVCKKINAEYVGNITTKTAIREDFSILVEGTVDYKSKNCNNVTAKYRAIIKVVIDKSVASGRLLQVECFYINTPKCVEGIQILYTKEYSVGSDECK